MKTAGELKTLKEELEALNKKLAELTEEELKQVAGGNLFYEYCPNCGSKLMEIPDENSQTIIWSICPCCGFKVSH